jgi:cell division protein FtsQ
VSTATTFRATASRPAGRATRPASPSSGRPRRRRWPRRLAVLVLVLALLVGCGWVVGYSGLFAVDRVEVTGLHRLDPESIRQVAAVPLGVPEVYQDLPAIEGRVSVIPQVASVRATRDWPRSIKITVVEREPLLGVLQPNGFAIIDRAGVAYETAATLPAGVVRADVDPSDVKLLAQVGAAVLAMPAGLKKQVARVASTSENAIAVILTSGVRVNWGSSADSALKAKVVVTLLKQRPTAIDVSSPHNPAIR